MIQQWLDQFDSILLPIPLSPLQLLLGLFIMYVMLVLMWLFFIKPKVNRNIIRIDQKIEKIEEAQQSDSSNKLVVEKYSLFLEKYVATNMRQNDSIFHFAKRMIIFGLSLTGVGILGNLLNVSLNISNESAWAAIISGLITAFFAIIILVVFKPFFQQPLEYFKLMIRMATIEAAVKTLENNPDRKEAAKLLLDYGLGIVQTAKESGVVESKDKL